MVRCIVVTSVCILWSVVSVGDSQQQLENQKRVFERLQKNQQQDILFFDVAKPQLEENISSKKDQPCIDIKQINGDSLALLSKREKKELFDPFKGSCRTIADINNLVKKLSTLYLDAGYVTSKVYLKPQAVKDGRIEFHAIEGKISKITPDELYIKNAFLGQDGDYLNLRALERSIETINRLPSNHATMKLVPGEEVGTTEVHIENKTTNRVNGRVNIDNYGEKNTGKMQGSLDLNLDNPFGLNDRLSIFVNSTENHNTIQNSRGSGYQYTLPIGNRFSLAFKYRKTTYERIIPAGITDYNSDGHTSTYNLDLSYKLFHNKNHRVNIGAFATHYKAENYIRDALIETSSYRISKAGGRIDYLYQMPGFYTFTAFSYSQGNSWFDDHNPTDLDEKTSYYTADFSLMKQFSSFKYSLNAHYQKAHNDLFSANQISIGGPYSVRGYKEEGITGNSGYYARHEISKTLPNKLFGEIEQNYFLAVDHGHIKREDSVKGGSLRGVAIGAKYTYKDLNAQLYYAIPLHHEDVSETSNFFGFSASYKF